MAPSLEPDWKYSDNDASLCICSARNVQNQEVDTNACLDFSHRRPSQPVSIYLPKYGTAKTDLPRARRSLQTQS